MTRRLIALGTLDRGELGLVYNDATGAVLLVDASGETDLSVIARSFGQSLGTQAADQTVVANYGAVITDEYVMDATHELVFSDPSEMVVI